MELPQLMCVSRHGNMVQSICTVHKYWTCLFVVSLVPMRDNALAVLPN